MQFCLVIIEQEKSYNLTFQAKHGTVANLLLRNDSSTLNYASFDHVILTGFFSGVIMRELEISRLAGRRELPASIQYKFVQNLPMNPACRRT